ncbi:MAG: sulfotransferase [Thermosynechococcaceae cyanobacterium]
MNNNKIKVLYIAGFERSGSTLVNRVLGQIDGFVAWGELRDIWEHGKIENRTCTCGSSFSKCDEWSAIYDKQFEQDVGLTANEMLSLKRKTRAAVLLKSLDPLSVSTFSKVPKRYLEGLENLYRSIQKKTHSKVIVDSTKAAWYGYILSTLENIDLYTVHIVRDPRGVCYSLQRRKSQGEPECQWYNPLHASLSWNLKNIGVERLLNRNPTRYLRMRYEDFVQAPEDSVRAILSLINEQESKLPFIQPSTVKMGVDHIISGSPSSRSETGSVQLKTDNKWQQKISAIDKFVSGYATLPLLIKYGYSYKA